MYLYAKIHTVSHHECCLIEHNWMQTFFTFTIQIVSCSGDGIIAYNDVERTDVHGRFLFNCHYGTAYEVSITDVCYLYFEMIMVRMNSKKSDCCIYNFGQYFSLSETKDSVLNHMESHFPNNAFKVG